MKSMMKTLLVAIAILTLASETHAANPYRIQLNAYRRMMRQRYPSHFSQSFWNFMDNRVLQEQGPLDRLINRLADQLATSENFATIAQKTPTQNQTLLSANARIDATLTKLGIPIPPSNAWDAPNPTGDFRSGITYEISDSFLQAAPDHTPRPAPKP